MQENQSNTQLAKKERRELRHQEQQQSQIDQQKKRVVKKITTWVITVLVIGASGYGLYYLITQPEKLRPGEAIPILGQKHITVGASHSPYNSNPPTSGWHYAQSADWGVYQQELPDEQLIHNLEHGGIWISYKNIDQKTKEDLEIIGKKYPESVVVTPRSANDANIVLASWGRLEKLESFNETKIVEFIKANTNKSPEPLAH